MKLFSWTYSARRLRNGVLFALTGEDGWTFIETLIVIGIILILTGSVGFMAYKYIDQAKFVSAKSQIDTYSLALDSYYIDCGQYPSKEQGLSALWAKPTAEPIPKNWVGPYISKKVQLDPWGNTYEYLSPGQNGLPFGIRSLGRDGQEGGIGNDADIASWED